MKNYIIVAVWFLFTLNSFSQNPFQDAIKLRGYIEPGSQPPKFIIPDETGERAFQEQRMKEYCEIVNRYYNNKFKSSKELHQGVGYVMIHN